MRLPAVAAAAVLLTGICAGVPADAVGAPGVSCPTVASNGAVTPGPGPGVDWSGCNLSSANLSAADLTAANLIGTDLSGANLSGAHLTNASLEAANMAGADVAGASLAGARMDGVSSGGVTGVPAGLPRFWSIADGYLIGPAANLTGADLAGMNLTSADLSGTILTGANLSGTSLSGADLTNVASGAISGTPESLPGNWILLDGFLFGPAAELFGANLSGLDLSSLDLAYANLRATDLDGAQLADSNLTDAYFDSANLTDASLAGATTTGATFNLAFWLNTTCPDGSNSNAYDDGCFSPLDTTPPAAHPSVTNGVAGSHGWYTSPVTVTWNWTDSGTIVTSRCTAASTATGSGKAIKVTAACTDLAGNVGHASFVLKIDRTRPAVTVTGIRNHHTYRKGHVPAAGCRTTDTMSGVARHAKLSITTTGRHGLGRFTATCAGAVSIAGTRQARPQRVTYTVIR